MAGEQTIPILACRHLDDVVPFYEALGFAVTYRQARPNPYLCLERAAIRLHFAAVAGFDPAGSLGSVIVLVPNVGELFDAFAGGLRAAYGKLPIAGIPRITRPRRRQGTAGGFSVVDPGGNWLRVSALGDTGNDTAEPAGRLDLVLRAAARQGDARGDVAAAIAVLEKGLVRHANAPTAERVPVLAYLVELCVRAGEPERGAAVLAQLRELDADAAAEAERDLAGS